MMVILTVLACGRKGQNAGSRSVGTRVYYLLSSLRGFSLSQQVDTTTACFFIARAGCMDPASRGIGHLHG